MNHFLRLAYNVILIATGMALAAGSMVLIQRGLPWELSLVPFGAAVAGGILLGNVVDRLTKR